MTAIAAPFPVPFEGELVRRALRRLPPRQRAVLCLRFAQGLTQRQVAAVLECSVTTVHALTVRGVRRVNQLLASEGAVEAADVAARPEPVGGDAGRR
ncbi:MAG TPA: sigma factor-like helix-turn-helix DNA-binding protein [Nitriliruptorales bacterium]|nr:sigma factor-like helix-turn-helix DNA-binding protein [Nitriliruptorales bacterium]